MVQRHKDVFCIGVNSDVLDVFVSVQMCGY
jgi:hypothetical protein